MVCDPESTAVWLSLKVALSVALWSMPPAIVLGWVLARRSFRGKVLLEGLIHAPLVMPPVVTGYLLLLVFGRRGLVGRWLYDLLGVQMVFTVHAAVLASVVVALPLAVRCVRMAIELVDARLEEAAFVLGYSPLRVFFRVTLPLAWTGVASGMLLSFARSLGEFGATITFAGNVEGVTQTLPLAIYSALQVPGQESSAMRLAAYSLGLCLVSLFASEALRVRNRRLLSDV